MVGRQVLQLAVRAIRTNSPTVIDASFSRKQITKEVGTPDSQHQGNSLYEKTGPAVRRLAMARPEQPAIAERELPNVTRLIADLGNKSRAACKVAAIIAS